MKKKYLALFCACLMALSLTACGGGTLEVPETGTPEATKAPESVKPTGYTVMLNGTELFIGLDMKTVYDKIGETAKISETGSCKYEGTEKEYKFAHVTVTAIIEGDVERIFSISFEDDLISTKEGVAIGDPVSKITVKYGAPETEGSYIYKKDNMFVMFTVKNDEVATVLYTEP